MSKSTDNLDTFLESPCVFDNQRSEVNTQVGHQVSFVLPTWLNQKADEFETVIIHGEAVYLKYSLGQEIEKFSFGKGFQIHGKTYPLSKSARFLHDKGVAESKRFQDFDGVTVIGAEVCRPPKVIYLEYVHVTINPRQVSDVNGRSYDLEAMCNKINKATGRNLKSTFDPVLNEHTLLVPGSWILQDLTAITRGSENESKTIPIIKYPLAFPSIGSRLSFRQGGEVRNAWIEDFDIVSNGHKVEVLYSEMNDRDSTDFLLYSNIYARNKSELLNPAIVRVVSPQDYLKIKENYLEDVRQYIFKHLTRWHLWKICPGKKGLKVLASTIPKKKGEKPKSQWLMPSQAIERSDLNIVSFEGGEVQLESDGVTSSRTIVYRDNIDPIVAGATIHFHDIPEEAKVTSLIFNAVNGHAETVVGSNRMECFFSTKNCEQISMNHAPLFAPQPCINRATVDVAQLQWVLGYPGKSKEEGHEDQTVVYWTAIPEALRNFYIWVTRRGNHSLFNGKKISEVRAIFESDEFPMLVEIFNLMVLGYTPKNPTSTSDWTEWFLQDIMCINTGDLQ